MATIANAITKSGKIAGYNIQWYDGKNRCTIYLGGRQYNRKTAERFKEGIEALLYYRRNKIPIPDPSTERWLATLSDHLRLKLAKVGLITLEEPKTFQNLWDAFLQDRADSKPATLQCYRSCQKFFYQAFAPAELIHAITPDQLRAWKQVLLSKYAPAGVASRLKVIGTILNWAVRREWLSKSPMQGIPIGSFVNRAKDRIISLAEYAKLLEACPNQEWRTIIALARIGGLRCPSELKRLRWSDIQWTQNRFVVRPSKTEQYAGHDKRMTPLFPELRSELERHFAAVKPKNDDFVVQRFQGTSWGSFRNSFLKITVRAGLGKIVRPFDNMRMSRDNEVVRRWGPALASLWKGHSMTVMEKHYLHSMDKDFTKAAREYTKPDDENVEG
jgi:integrase